MQARLLESREIAPATRHFVFELPEVEQFNFAPGQFVSFHADINGQQITRAYSIASAPAGNRGELCLNLVQDGHLSPHLFAMKPGETVAMTGPFGTFFFRDPPQDSVLIATGTGISAFLDQLKREADKYEAGSTGTSSRTLRQENVAVSRSTPTGRRFIREACATRVPCARG